MKPKVKPLITLTFFFLIAINVLMAGIITVKQDGTGDYTTIQAGMNACAWNSGDTVLVWPGVYYENIIYNGRHITIASLYVINQDKWYINHTIIDGNHDGPCVTMNGGQFSMTIDGFIIRNGESTDGFGGIFINYSNAIINNCYIQYNKGCGIACYYSIIYLSSTTIRYNHCIRGGGGLTLGIDADVNFDTINRSNIYMNYSYYGCDIIKSFLSPQPLIVYLDTLTVLNPDIHFVYSYSEDNIPVNDIELNINHGYLQPVEQDLYINPATGDDDNSGISPSEPLKTIAYAYMLIKSDSLNPHAIHLANGVYSPSANGEKLPLGTRSYISLIGENQDSTIIDADSLSSFILGYGLMKNYSIENLTFTRGKGGIYIERNDHVKLKNITLKNSGSITFPGICLSHIDSLNIENLTVVNYKAGGGFTLDNDENPKSFRMVNCSIINTIPSDDPINQGGGGGGMRISGGYQLPFSYIGEIINLRVTGNLTFPHPMWGPGMVGGFTASDHCKINLINSTIGHNVLRGSYGFGTNTHSGAELNIYNSILYGDSLKELSLGYPNILDNPAICRVNYSNIEGGQNEVQNWNGINTLVWGQGNIDSDPLWDTTAAIPYSIPYDSPCRNTGTPIYSPGMQPPYIIHEDTIYSLVTPEYDTISLPSTDLRGKPRIMEGRIDMGAYEYDPFTSENEQKLPEEVEVVSVYPNPFYSNVFISLDIKKAGYVKAEIYDMQGHLLKSLMDTDMPIGRCTLTWDGKDELGWDVKIGEYLLKLSIDGRQLPGVKIVRGKWR